MDKYTFSPVGLMGMRLSNRVYNAAHWLEINGHAKAVEHKITFTSTFDVLVE